MKKFSKKVSVFIFSAIMCILMSFNVLASPNSYKGIALTADDFPNAAPGASTFSESDLVRININTPPTITLEETMTMNQQGEPLDSMYFYWLQLYPIVRKPSTNEISVINSPLAIVNRQDRQWYENRFSQETTNAMYSRVINAGYDMLGWQVKFNFRFDFITPTMWTRIVDNNSATEVSENVPQPHNPYQTYIFTYNSFFQTNPLEPYSSSLSGDVDFFDKYDKKYKKSVFAVTTHFNAN